MPDCDCGGAGECAIDECPPAPRVRTCPDGEPRPITCERVNAACTWIIGECQPLSCEDGQVEIDGACVLACAADNECPNGQACNAGDEVCLQAPGCAENPDAPCIDLCFGFCVPDGECSVDGSDIDCRRLPPGMSSGTLAEIRDRCYTGRCLSPDECRGEQCRPGDTKPADDGCNECVCMDDGGWACTKRGCPEIDVCNRDGQPLICDAEPPRCEREGDVPEVAFGCFTGACVSWRDCQPDDRCQPGDVKPADDGCNTCACDDNGGGGVH